MLTSLKKLTIMYFIFIKFFILQNNKAVLLSLAFTFLSQNMIFFLKQSTLFKSFLQGVLSKLTSIVHIAAEICTLLQVKVVETSVSLISINFFTVSSRVFFDIFVLLFYSLPSKYTNPMVYCLRPLSKFYTS